MDSLYLILYVAGAVLFLLAGLLGWGWSSGPRAAGWGNLVALGLLCWILVPLIAQARGM
jgi:hypothetical protein